VYPALLKELREENFLPKKRRVKVAAMRKKHASEKKKDKSATRVVAEFWMSQAWGKRIIMTAERCGWGDRTKRGTSKNKQWPIPIKKHREVKSNRGRLSGKWNGTNGGKKV